MRYITMCIYAFLIFILQGCCSEIEKSESYDEDTTLLTEIKPVTVQDLIEVNHDINNIEDIIFDYRAEDYMDYPISSQYKTTSNDICFELVISLSYSQQILDRDVKVFISYLNDEGIYELDQIIINNGHTGDAWNKEGLYLVDVNFDGKLDIVVSNGHYGAQGAIEYSAYLWNGSSFRENLSFRGIPNAAIDIEREYILGWWRSNAASHCHAKYVYKDDVFALDQLLTIKWAVKGDENSEDEENYITEYIVQYDLFDSEGITEIYSTEKYSVEYLEEMFGADDSEWAIYSGKWKQIAFMNQ